MRRLIGVALVAVLGCKQPSSAAAPANVARAQLAGKSGAEAANAFSSSLYGALAGKNDGDLIVSPLSVHLAGGMALLGARGTTQAELQRALALGGSPDDAAASLAGVQKDLLAATGVELSIANRLFLESHFKPRPAYLSACEERFGAQPESISMGPGAGEHINEWVKAQTRGHLSGVMPPGPIDASAVLVNAIYFKGKWTDPFKPRSTHEAPFWGRKSVVNVQMMAATLKSPYVSGAGYQIVELPYAGETFSLVLVVPDAEQGLTALEKTFNLAWLSAQLSKASVTEYDLRLPRLTLETSLELTPELKSLGAERAFSSGADFSGITDEPLYISKVFHRARIDVGEEGTEASAATAVLLTKGMGKMETTLPPQVDADHPFLFALRHRPSGAVLFLGRVAQPPGAAVEGAPKFTPVDPSHAPRKLNDAY